MSLGRVRVGMLADSFPRVSGDEPRLIAQGRAAVGFSPRERG